MDLMRSPSTIRVLKDVTFSSDCKVTVTPQIGNVLLFYLFTFLGEKKKERTASRITRWVRFSISVCGTETHSVFSVWFGRRIESNGGGAL